MRIAVFSIDDYFPPAGGAELANGHIMKGLPEYSFDLYCLHEGEPRPRKEVDGNITIHRVSVGSKRLSKFLFPLTATATALWRHMRQPYDMSWAIMVGYGGLCAYFFYLLTRRPYLLTLQEGDKLKGLEKRMRPLAWLYARTFFGAKTIQAISRYLKDWAINQGADAGCISIVPNGVDVERFQLRENSEQRARIRKELFNVGDEAVVLVTTSRLVEKNGVGDVINALPDLPEHVHFVICGDGSLRNSLEALAASLKVESRAHFLGSLPPDDIPGVLSASNIFIRPSLSEGLGNSFLEAMMIGLPVIGTPVGGIPDFLLDGQTGFFCKPNNPASIVNAVHRILAMDKTDWIRVRDQAREVVRKKYTWPIVVKQMRELFELTKRSV